MALDWQVLQPEPGLTNYTLVLPDKTKVVVAYDTTHQNRVYAKLYMVHRSSLYQSLCDRLIVAQKNEGEHVRDAVYHFTVAELQQKAQNLALEVLRAESEQISLALSKLKEA